MAARVPSCSPAFCSALASGSACSLNWRYVRRAFSRSRSASIRQISLGQRSSAARSASPSELNWRRSSIRNWPQRHRGTEKICSESNDKPFDAVVEEPRIEIDQKSHFFPRRSQICQNLSFKNCGVSFHAFDFDDYEIFDDQIQAIVAQSPPLIQNGAGNLTLELYISNFKFDTQGVFVSGFEQAGTKMAMNFDGAANNLFGQLFVFSWLHASMSPWLEPGLNPLGESAEVGYALEFVVGELDLEMLFDAREEVECLEAVDAEFSEEIVVGGELVALDFEMFGGEVQDFIGGLVNGVHAFLSCHNFGWAGMVGASRFAMGDRGARRCFRRTCAGRRPRRGA